MSVAVTRPVPESIGHSELTHLERAPIDIERAREQHAAYRDKLRALGCEVQELPEEPALPDSVFVEDTTIVLPEIAVMTRPGADSRQPEVESVARVLAQWRSLRHIEAPGTLDGGDVLVIGKQIFVGETGRSNTEGIRQLRDLVGPFGYEVRAVAVSGCLHLKSAVTQIAANAVLLNPACVDPEVFSDFDRFEVDAQEPVAANAVWLGGPVLLPAAGERTRQMLEQAGIEVMTVDADELAKAEGGLTCCSVIVSR